MSFLRANIDRAIVMTQYDLRGFAHPLGFRVEKPDPKYLDATTANFMEMAIGTLNKSEERTDDSHASYFDSSFEEYLVMCQRLAKDCDLSQKEAIQLIIREIVKQADEMKAEVTAGTRKASGYLRPLEKGNRWGNAVLALAEAFEVTLEGVAA